LEDNVQFGQLVAKDGVEKQLLAHIGPLGAMAPEDPYDSFQRCASDDTATGGSWVLAFGRVAA
jgi:hypothetical protein